MFEEIGSRMFQAAVEVLGVFEMDVHIRGNNIFSYRGFVR